MLLRALLLTGCATAAAALEIPAGILATGDTEDGGSVVVIGPGLAATLAEALVKAPAIGQQVPLTGPGGRKVTATIERLGTTTTAVLLRLPTDAPPLAEPLAIGTPPAIGTPIWTVGNSIGALVLDGASAVSRGVVSGRDSADAPETRGRGGAVVSRYRGPVLEITAAVNEGSQGGAVVDEAGRLVGLATCATSRARRQSSAVPWPLIAADLGLPVAEAVVPADPADPAWLVTIAWRRPGGLGNPEAIPRPPRPVEAAPPAERPRLGDWWKAWFHQRQVFRTDAPCPAVVVDPAAGLLLTAASQLAGGATSGTLLVGGQRIPVGVVATDQPLDLALIQADAPVDLPAAPWAEAIPGIASPIRILGRHRSDAPATRTDGVVSALNRRLTQSPQGFFQVDARADYGSLGGAVVDATGRIAGLVVHLGPQATETPWLVASGVTLVVDAPTLRAALVPMLAGTSRAQPPTLGLGVGMVEEDGRLVVRTVVPGTGAAAAGIAVGDVLVAVAGRPATSPAAVSRVLLRHQAGDRLPVTIERTGRRLRLEVEVRSFAGRKP